MKGTTPLFRGILAVGNTKSEAINRYRLLALGKGVSMFANESQSSAFIGTNASGALAELFNPETGDMDIVQANNLLEGLEFESRSSDVEVNHYECTAGCGAHLVYDDETLVKFCPVCASSVIAGDEESDEDLEDSEPDDLDEEDSESDDLDLEDSESDDLDLEDSEPDDLDEEDSESDDLDEESDDSAEEEDQPVVVAASSLEEASKLYAKEKLRYMGTSESSDSEVHYVVCSSAECGAHILSDEEVSACPACSAEVEEPEEDSLSKDNLVFSMSEDESDEEDSDEDDSDEEDKDDSDEEDEEDLDEEDSEPDDLDEEDLEESDADEPLVVAASSLEEAKTLYLKHSSRIATAASDSEVHYVVCSSAECGAHILSDEEVSACPACSAEVEEPEEDVEDLDLSIVDEDGEDDSDLDEEEPITDESSLSDDDLDDVEDEETMEVDVDPMDDIEESESAHKDLDIVYASTLQGGAKWLAVYKGQPVASVSRDLSGKNKDVFDTPTFGQIVIAAAKHAGVRPALKELGFTPFTKTISISTVVERLSAEKIQEATASLDKEKAQYEESLEAALATAAVGLNRGFFVGMKNPLKESLHSALAAAGIKNPEIIIANVFRDHADSYHKQLFTKARDILTKPEEVRTALAKTVLETNYSESTSNNGIIIDEKLANMGRVTASDTTPVPEQSHSAEIVNMAKVVSSLGRRR